MVFAPVTTFAALESRRYVASTSFADVLKSGSTSRT